MPGALTGRPLALRAYRAISGLGAPIVELWLNERARREKEDRTRLPERFGQPSLHRPPGFLLWLHGVSVGESLSLVSIVERARVARPDAAILVTSGTRASAEVMMRRLPDGVIHQFAPVDTPSAAAAFIGHWRPGLAVFAESELWPNLLGEAKVGGAKLALVSARMSAASARRWRLVPHSAAALFGLFDLVLARDDEEAQRLKGLGARVDGLIDLKFGAPLLPADPRRLAVHAERWRDRAVILAASTHPGEDELVLEAFRNAGGVEAGAVLVIVPRHPSRGPAVADLASADGVAAARASRHDDPGAASVYVADTVGDLGLWYRLARLALVGGSLCPGVGGHNPLEPARLGCPFVAGAFVEGWPIYRSLVARGATRLVAADGLSAAISEAIADDSELAAMALAARRFAEEGDRLTEAGLDRVIRLLP